jgi:hypothetical protein
MSDNLFRHKSSSPGASIQGQECGPGCCCMTLAKQRHTLLHRPLYCAALLLAVTRSGAFSTIGVGWAQGARSALADASSSASMAAADGVVVVVAGASVEEVNGEYGARAPGVVPAGFTATCLQMRWDPAAMWTKLSDGRRLWFEADNGSYIYWNRYGEARSGR